MSLLDLNSFNDVDVFDEEKVVSSWCANSFIYEFMAQHLSLFDRGTANTRQNSSEEEKSEEKRHDLDGDSRAIWERVNPQDWEDGQ